MKLTLALTDTRNKITTYYQANPETEEYRRVDLPNVVASQSVIAGILRAVADEIDPRPGITLKENPLRSITTKSKGQL